MLSRSGGSFSMSMGVLSIKKRGSPIGSSSGVIENNLQIVPFVRHAYIDRYYFDPISFRFCSYYAPSVSGFVNIPMHPWYKPKLDVLVNEFVDVDNSFFPFFCILDPSRFVAGNVAVAHFEFFKGAWQIVWF
jgi:hypothetical protein